MLDPESVRPVGSVSLGIEEFQNERKAAERDYLHSVIRLAVGTLICGILIIAASYGLRQHLVLHSVLETIGTWCCSGAVVLLSTCPLEAIDANAVLAESTCLRRLLAITAAVYESVLGILFMPRVHFSAAACCLLLLSTILVRRCRQEISTALVLAFALDTIAFLANDIWSGTNPAAMPQDGVEVPVVVWTTSACIRAMGLVVFGICSLRPRKRGTTTALCYAIYGYFITQGVARIFRAGAMAIHTKFRLTTETSNDRMPLQGLLGGFGLLTPLLVSTAFGRARVSGFFARRFHRNRNRAIQSGAFIAGLLDSRNICVGMEWWQHRGAGNEDVSRDEGDPLRHWRRGIITEVHSEGFKLSYNDSRNEAFNDESPELVPMASRRGSIDEISTAAKRNLRCIEWSNLTLELLKSGPICGSADPALQANSYYQLSRPVPEGEEIDFFLSHSWSDDADAKYEVLESVVDTFFASHGRSPTFWFDKVCIDQLNIEDGLRVLPVNVMACRRMLILCGNSYSTRLWCVWEIFTLVAFMSLDQALERLYFAPLEETGDETAIVDKLQRFCVDDARCFNPNDSARLKRIIGSLGNEDFNARIRQIGDACAAKRPGLRVSKTSSRLQQFEEMIGRAISMHLPD